MKKIFLALALFSAVAFSLPASASAATSAGVKPGSFFYFFDTTFEQISLFFTFSPEKKVEKALAYADERLAEVEVLAEEQNPNAVKTAITNYENNIALAAEKSKEVQDKGKAENLLTLIADNTSKNQEVLAAVLIKVPKEAREAITQAIEVSKKGQEEAIRQITELKSEVEQLKKEVAELKAKDETQTKTVEELSKQKSESALMPIKSPTPIVSETPYIPRPSSNISSQEDMREVIRELQNSVQEIKSSLVKPVAPPPDVKLNAVSQGLSWRKWESGKIITIVPEQGVTIQVNVGNPNSNNLNPGFSCTKKGYWAGEEMAPADASFSFSFKNIATKTTLTFEVVCSNGGGFKSDSVNVLIVPLPELDFVINNLTTRLTLKKGDTATTNWFTSHAQSCLAQGNIKRCEIGVNCGDVGMSLWSEWSGEKGTAGSQIISFAEEGNYQLDLTCQNEVGKIMKSLTIDVYK